MIEHLRAGVFCRLQRSPLHGVGVFAVREIRQGTQMFESRRSDERVISREELVSLPPGVRDLVRDFGVERDGQVHILTADLHRPCLSFFINHSETPNCAFFTDDEADWCEALRDIPAGEELCRDYREDDGADYALRGGEKHEEPEHQ